MADTCVEFVFDVRWRRTAAAGQDTVAVILDEDLLQMWSAAATAGAHHMVADAGAGPDLAHPMTGATIGLQAPSTGGHRIGIGTAPHGDLLATESTAWHLELHI